MHCPIATKQACVRVNVLYENGPEEVAIAGPFDSWRMRRHALQMHAMHLREKAFAATQSDLQAPPALVENGSTNEHRVYQRVFVDDL